MQQEDGTYCISSAHHRRTTAGFVDEWEDGAWLVAWRVPTLYTIELAQGSLDTYVCVLHGEAAISYDSLVTCHSSISVPSGLVLELEDGNSDDRTPVRFLRCSLG